VNTTQSEPAVSPVKRALGKILLGGFSLVVCVLTVGFWFLAYQNLAAPHCDKHLMHAGDTCSRLHVPGARGGYTQEHLNHPGDQPAKLTLPNNFHPAPDDVSNGVYSQDTIQRLHHGDGLQFLAGAALFTSLSGIQALRWARARRAPSTDDPNDLTAWNAVPLGAGRRAHAAVVTGALPAEPRYRHGLRSAAIFFGALAAAAGAFAGTSSLIGVTDDPFWMEALAAFTPIGVLIAAVMSNRKLSERYRARMRRHATTTTGEIVDCTTYRIRSTYCVNLTVRFLDPEFRDPPRWIRRNYMFNQMPTTAAQFATIHGNGTVVPVYRNPRGTWYGLDIADDHLIWSQWW
jgi:hypothetical protein